MKKTKLILINVLVLIILSLCTNAWVNCTPSACDAGYTDNGVVCLGGDCTRNCTTEVCGSNWTQVHSTTFGWGTEIEDEQDDSSSSYQPTSSAFCYNFSYDGPPASTNNIRMDIDPHPTYDCRPVMMGGFRESNNWFSSLGCYVGTQSNSQVTNLCKIVIAAMDGEEDSDEDYMNDASGDGSIYCAPNSIACNAFSQCETDCYNKSTYGHTVQGYYKDKGTAAVTIYDGVGCGNSYVDNNKMTPIAYSVYQAEVVPQNDDKSCERTNEAPTASGVQVIPQNPTAGDDLICNFTYYDPEGFEEKDSTFDWRKNGISQGANTQVLASGNLTINDKWSCEVIPSDGLINGTKVSSSNATILSTIQNPKMYISDSISWSFTGFYSDKGTATDFSDELNDALDGCTADEDDYCNISITFSSDASGKLNLSELGIYYEEEQEEGTGNLTITSLTNITINNTHMVFEFVINNTGETTLNDVNWTLDPGDGSSLLACGENTFSLAESMSALVFVEYNYSSESVFVVNATASSGTLTSHKTLNIYLGNATPGIDVYDYSVYDVSETYKIFSFGVKNIDNFNMTDVGWSLNTGIETINSDDSFNLTPNNFTLVFVEYNYTQTGDFSAIASASSGIHEDSETLNVDIPDIEVSNLSLIVNNSLNRIFFFTITNTLSTPMNYVNWTFDTDDNNVISANQLFGLNQSEEGWVFVEYNYSSTGTYSVNATATNGTLRDSDYYTFTIS